MPIPALDPARPESGETSDADGLALARECRIYSIKAAFTAGTVYTETPNDSTIPGVLATLDTTLGTFTPKAIGFGKPTGLLYLP